MIITIRDLKDQEKGEFYAILRKPEIKTAKNGKNYLAFTLADRTGSISGVLWDYNPAENSIHEKTGIPVKARGAAKAFRNELQFTAENLRPVTAKDGVTEAEIMGLKPEKKPEPAAEVPSENRRVIGAHLNVSDMAVGNIIRGYYLLRSASVCETKTGQRFLCAMLSDLSGTINAKVWDYCGDVHEHAGAIVYAEGECGEFEGRKQATLDRLRTAEPCEAADAEYIIPSAPIDTGKVMPEIRAVLNSLEEPYRAVTLAVYEEQKNLLESVPAAQKMHHAFVGGLLMHTYDIMRMASAAAKIYEHVPVNRSLLMAGAFLHDIAKPMEYVRSECGLVSDYTAEGNLTGHPVMGAELMCRTAEALGLENAPEILLLKHMILSHHGRGEWGAAVSPLIAEAYLLSLLDLLDSRMEMYRETLEVTEPLKMSEFVKGLGARVFRHC